MNKVFRPNSIAIVGASSSKGKIGNILMDNLSRGKKLKIFPVNPGRDKVMGLKAYPSVLDIPEKVDLAIIVVPAKFVAQAVKECAWKDDPIKNIVIISAGFSEVGKEGVEREKELLDLAHEYNLNIVGPNCLGVVNTYYKMNASFAEFEVPVGNVGLIAQSGAFTTALFDLFKVHGLGFSLVTTLGNKVDINENDLIEFYAKDPNTKTIALYLEDVAEGRELISLVNKISPKKPVVVIKAGTSEKAQKAIQSHTGAMAGDVDVIRESIRDNGGVFCDNFSDFVGFLKLAEGFNHPGSDKVVFVTNAGGPGVIATDLIDRQQNISLYSFSASEKKNLKKSLPAESSVENPVDVLGDAMDDRYKAIFEKCAAIKKIGAVCAIVTPQAQTPVQAIAKEISLANKKYKIPFIPVVIGGAANTRAAEVLNKEGLTTFAFPLEAIKALSVFVDYSNAVKKKRTVFEKKKEVKKTPLLKKLEGENRNVLLYGEAASIGKKAGLTVLPAKVLKDQKDAKKIKSGFPVVAKIDSPTVLHKNAKDGLSLGIASSKELLREYRRLKKLFKNDNVIVQRQIEEGMELIMGIKKDPSFGHVLMLGLGGIFTEALDLKYLWSLPVNQKDILEKIKETPLAQILKKKKIDIKKVAKEAEKVGKIASTSPFIEELDVNPIIMYPNKNPVVVDIKIIVNFDN